MRKARKVEALARQQLITSIAMVRPAYQQPVPNYLNPAYQQFPPYQQAAPVSQSPVQYPSQHYHQQPQSEGGMGRRTFMKLVATGAMMAVIGMTLSSRPSNQTNIFSNPNDYKGMVGARHKSDENTDTFFMRTFATRRMKEDRQQKQEFLAFCLREEIIHVIQKDWLQAISHTLSWSLVELTLLKVEAQCLQKIFSQSLHSIKWPLLEREKK